MHVETLTLHHLVYNPEDGSFAAIAEIKDKGRAYAYPVQFRAAPSAEFTFIAQGLARKATRHHRQTSPRALRLRRTRVPSTTPAPGFPSRAGTRPLRHPGAAPAV